jgi:hypothetical protein
MLKKITLTLTLAFSILFLNAQLVISELHYAPLSQNIADSTASGSLFEFIEIKNIGNNSINVSNAQFVRGVVFTFPDNLSIEPNQIVVICNNSMVFNFFYPNVNTIGQFESGRLDNSGERLLLTKGNDTLIDLTYSSSAPWPETPNNLGFSLVLKNQEGDINNPINWRASSQVGGSPGTETAEIDIAPIVVSEIIANTECPSVDVLELYNPTNSVVDIGGWYLTDRWQDPQKWRIPNGTIIEANSTLVFYAGLCNGQVVQSTPNQFGSQFNLSSKGEDVYIFSAQNNTLTGYSHGYTFPESAPNTSFGRYINSDGKEFFIVLEGNNLGEIEKTPLIPQLVFEEIMYNPLNDELEYLKITNNTSDELNIEGWVITGVSFDNAYFQNVILSAGESFYLIQDSLGSVVLREIFREAKELDSDVKIFPYSGALSNSGERLTIRRPGEIVVEGLDVFEPFYVVDEVRYNDKYPWPISADGHGEFLIRINKNLFGSDPANWRASVTAKPIANAGRSAIVNINQTVTLDGSESYDINFPNATLLYFWEIFEKPLNSNATLSNPNIVNPSFVCDAVGKYVFTLVVENGGRRSIADTVVIFEYDFFLPIYENNENNSIKVYPTVSNKDYVNIISASEITSIKLFNIKGEVISKQVNLNFKDGQIKIPKQSGEYFINVSTNAETKTFKIFKID